MTKTFGTNASREVIATLEAAGHEAVFVGGSVRDHLLGKNASDIDIATSALPEEVKEVFSATIDVGIEHGTILVLMNGEPIEVTSYRTDSTYSDHRRPDGVLFVKSLREDLGRRDFTMNAIALTLTGELVDPYGGVSDLRKGLIRAVDNPEERFSEDSLRMLRAVRFSSVLGFGIDYDTYTALTHNAPKIRQVSVERIKSELDKIWTGKHPQKAIDILMETGLASHLPLFPKDAQTLINSVPFANACEGWASLMLTGDFTVSEITNAYKLSNKEKSYLTDVRSAFTNRSERIFTVDDYYHFSLDVLLAAEKAFSVFHPEASFLNETEIADALAALPIRSKEDLQVDGKDLMDWTNERGGRWVGKWIGKIEWAVLHGVVQNNANDIKEWFLDEYTCEK